MTKNKRRVLYLLLGLIFIPPLLMRKIAGELEPYPAIIFPAGANQVQISDSSSSVLEGAKIMALMQKENDYKEINSESIITGFHQLYWNALAKKNFNLSLDDDTISRRDEIFGHVVLMKKRDVREEDVERAKQWIREKLKQNSYHDSVILIRKFEFRVTRSKIKTESVSDEIIELY